MAGPTFGKNPPADRLDFGIVTGQHWWSWEQLLETWQWADETGWDSAWGFDHFFSLSDGELGQTLEGWTMLAALAMATKNVQLGLLVTGNTHRNPTVLAKQAATVDVISGGRLILGIGAAWNEREHAAHGIDFPSPRERVDRFGEALEIMRLLETQERSTIDGQYYQLVDAPFEPKPVHGHMPILIGSTGKRMLSHIARYADQWDGGGTPEEYRAVGEQLNERCREIGRDPADIRWALGRDESVLESADRFRAHVAAYSAIGVRSFLVDMPRGGPDAALRALASSAIAELRDEFAATGRIAAPASA